MLLWPSAAFAVPWWVPDEPTAAQMRAQLAAFWPDAPVSFEIGPPPADGIGLSFDGHTLTLRGPDRTFTEESPPDPATLVVLARSWSKEVARIDQGWVPKPPVESLESQPPPPMSRPQTWWVDLTLGTRDTWTEPGLADGVRIGVRGHRKQWTIEGTMFVASNAWTGLGMSVAGIPEGESLQHRSDTFTFDLCTGWSAALGHRSRKLVAGPMLFGGVEARDYAVLTATHAGDRVEVDVSGGGAAIGPVIAGGVELSWRDLVGGRLFVAERFGFPIIGSYPGDRQGMFDDHTIAVDFWVTL